MAKRASGKKTGTEDGGRNGDGNETAWAKNTIGGPSNLPDAPGTRASKASRSRSGTPDADDAIAGRELVTKAVATSALAAGVPNNPLKASEYDEAAAIDPEAGRAIEPSTPSVTGSTLSESIPSDKTGAGEPSPGTNANDGSLDRVRADAGGRVMTTNQGVPVAQNQDSLKVGTRGPSLLQDFVLREKLTHFDHERIPERVVHARGSGAHGYFECTNPLTEHSRASVFAEAGKRTPAFARFSTVAGERGSADTARDVRGFAVKFYTDEGVWDLVGNNIPVFFIQDAMKFPDLIHAVKPEPHNGMPQAASAHDTFWDFVSLMPESAHMLLWVMSDRAIPRSLRTMQGFGVHTFRLVNAERESVLCKFHWTPTAGTHALVWDEAVKIAGADADFHRRDLWESIEAGLYPEWELAVQIFTEDQAEEFSFDVLDPTKLVPEELVPLTPVGRLVLNRNPDNFFAETEQVAFCTAHVVPGIDFTNDPLLQGRIHSYIDTQITRLGGANFHEIPINAPLAPVHNNQRDGIHRQAIHRGRVSYEPNSLAGGCPFQAGAEGFVPFPHGEEGDTLRGRPERFADHYTQARLFWASQTPAEQAHIVNAFRFELTRVQAGPVRQRVVSLLANVDTRLATAVAGELGIADLAPLPRVLETPNVPEVAKSPRLSLTARPGELGARGRRVAILVASGAQGVTEVHTALAAGGAVPRYLGSTLGTLKDADGGTLEVDVTMRATPSVLYDAVVLPDGRSAIDQLIANDDAIDFVREQHRHCKPIFAPGAAGAFLEAAGLSERLPSGEADAALLRPRTADAAAIAAFVERVGAHRDFGREPKS